MRFPERPRPAIQRVFCQWHEEMRGLFLLPLRLVSRTDRKFEMTFKGANQLAISLTKNELNVGVFWQGMIWDILLSLEYSPMHVRSGYQCLLCLDEERRIYPTLEALWRDHIFEPFLEWTNSKLAMADHIAVFEMNGSTWATLVSSSDVLDCNYLVGLIALRNQVIS